MLHNFGNKKIIFEIIKILQNTSTNTMSMSTKVHNCIVSEWWETTFLNKIFQFKCLTLTVVTFCL